LPKTAVGKIFKPELRKRAITRVLDATLTEAGLPVHVVGGSEDKKRGLVAQLATTGEVDDAKLVQVLGAFTVPWAWAE
jgi:fatty-acyl-CoA synthase